MTVCAADRTRPQRAVVWNEWIGGPGARPPAGFATAEEAISDVRAGRFVVVLDAQERENEGDLVIAAAFAGPDAINMMATHARGLVCVALTGERCDTLGLRRLPDTGARPHAAAFTVSVEARAGVSTGISTHDRAHTIAVVIDPATTAQDIVRPGHVLPLRARDGGVLERAGHTEAAVDLARLAGVGPAAVVCTIINDDGTMARPDDLLRWCERHRIRLVSTSELVAYRLRTDALADAG
ncbi:3,4-dihydroxy-2-butanone-4-phosphate synthase [Conexibacter sp. CPCC 206217]|uniref:3,4-dihydroxy-2-butanone-4-phosphate synthase n=1 Tax=Conexibacter sp. CPCC 206217 TaxID=3064574 RepID=UPI0027204303|nr:3,4-dihydroxy-2-butanone-4-phosphate synthase [Conexibacter sp. CPCC 206217]MDO8208926.1 3,4-dihydroxy-2-butanone-4-phosphate synthase [Conexibacter sp. CPCC 206217]